MILDVIDRFKQLNCGFAIQCVTGVTNFEKPLKIRRKLDSIADQQDESSPIERHCSPDFNKHIRIQNVLFFRILINESLFSIHVNYCGAAATHLTHDFT